MKISGNLSISPMIDEPAVYELTTVPSNGAQPAGAVVASVSGPATATATAETENKSESESQKSD